MFRHIISSKPHATIQLIETPTFAQKKNDMLKHLLFTTALSAVLCNADAQTVRTPQPSTTQTIKQEFALGNIELSYARPNMRGREIFGKLVPYGKVWRTGANAPTTLTFSDTVTIGGSKIAPGKYGLLTIPNQNEWTVIISKQTDVTSAAAYKQDMDAARLTVKPTTQNNSIETFTLQFANVKSASADLQMMWDKMVVTVPITTEVDSRVMAQIQAAMNNDNRPYYQSAMYYYETGKDLNQAVQWFDKAIEQNPNAFWIHYHKANALAKLGKKEEARKAATRSLELAKQANWMDYVTLNEELLKNLK